MVWVDLIFFFSDVGANQRVDRMLQCYPGSQCVYRMLHGYHGYMTCYTTVSFNTTFESFFFQNGYSVLLCIRCLVSQTMSWLKWLNEKI